MKRKLLFLALTLSPTIARANTTPPPNPLETGAGVAKSSNQPGGLFGDSANPGAFNTIANVLIGVAGAVAVLVLIAGGFMYITSNGEAKRVQQAKDTILYAIIGLVVVILAYAIVGFVTSSLTK